MTRMPHGLSAYDQLMKAKIAPAEEQPKALPATFGRLHPEPNPVQIKNLTHAELIAIYDHLATDMAKGTDKTGTAPAGMTFFGQFVDHDVTLDATSALGTRIVPSTIPNVRTPSLDLDCVYGSGPEASPHLYGKDKTKDGGNNTRNFLVYGNEKAEFDLARTANGTALIGDPRNDENAIVSQIQANFVALHNILMSECIKDDSTRDAIKACAHMGMANGDWSKHVPDYNMIFEEVRRVIRMHYQYAVWEELLPAFVDQSCLDEARVNDLFGADAAIMPVEFSGAAYRFGHATAQPDYRLRSTDKTQISMDKNLGFGQRGDPVDMAHFFDIDGKAAQKARPVGPTLGKPLTRLPFIDEPMTLDDIGLTLTVGQSKDLPLRNILRDRYTYLLQNGEKFAHWMRDELDLSAPDVTIHPDLKKHGITKTPLWFYCLQEADQHGGGKLTGVGGAIVASVFARMLRLDPTSYWHAHGFQPSDKFANDGGVLAGMMKYAEVHRDGGILHPDDLRNG